MLADSASVTGRASPFVWSMSTPAACLLLSQFGPATARLFTEFRRLRDSLPPAEARKFAECTEDDLLHAEMMSAVRLCACRTSRVPVRLHGRMSQVLAPQTTCTVKLARPVTLLSFAVQALSKLEQELCHSLLLETSGAAPGRRRWATSLSFLR